MRSTGGSPRGSQSSLVQRLSTATASEGGERDFMPIQSMAGSMAGSAAGSPRFGRPSVGGISQFSDRDVTMQQPLFNKDHAPPSPRAYPSPRASPRDGGGGGMLSSRSEARFLETFWASQATAGGPPRTTPRTPREELVAALRQ